CARSSPRTVPRTSRRHPRTSGLSSATARATTPSPAVHRAPALTTTASPPRRRRSARPSRRPDPRSSSHPSVSKGPAMIEIVAVSTGLSEDSTTTRLSERMLTSAQTALEAAGATVRTTHVNVRHLAKALTELTVSGFPAPQLEEAFAAVSRASAVITVAPVYKGAPAGIHTLFWQLIDDAALAGTPVLLGATGGTPRHSLAVESTLRPMISYLKGYALPTAVFAATDDWAGGAQSGLEDRIAAA